MFKLSLDWFVVIWEVKDVRPLGRRLDQSSDSIRVARSLLVCLPRVVSVTLEGLPQTHLIFPRFHRAAVCGAQAIPNVDTVQYSSLYWMPAPQRQNLLLSRPIYASPKKRTTSKQLHSSGEE